MEKTVQNLLQCLRNVICGEDVPLIAMSETEQKKLVSSQSHFADESVRL